MNGGVTTDTVPPATTPFGVPFGWNDLDSVNVTLSALDAGSSVAYTMYSINGSVPQTYTAPISVSAEGTNTITYWSVDTAPVPNREPNQITYVRLDRSGPSVTSQLVQSAAGPVRVTLTATDAHSGVDDFIYDVDGVPQAPVSGPGFQASILFSTPGTHTVSYRLWDVAGHETTGSTSVFVKDRYRVSKSPVAAGVVLRRVAGRAVWRSAVSVRSAAGAPLAGKRVALQKWNGRAWVNQRVVTTSARGVGSVAVTLTRAERAYWRWYVPADSAHALAVSARTLVTVR